MNVKLLKVLTILILLSVLIIPTSAIYVQCTNGTAATLNINWTFTGAPGTSALVTNIGDEYNALLDITIPAGVAGAAGGGVDVSEFLTRNGSVVMTGNLQMGTNRITGLGEPLADTDAATQGYVLDQVVGMSNYNSSYATTIYVGEVNTSMKDYVDSLPVSNYNSSYWTGSNYNESYITSTYNETYDAYTASTVSVTVNNTVTLAAGESATVANIGNTTNVELDFGVPQGIQGETGEPGATGGTGGQVLFFHHDPVPEPAGYEGLFPVPAGSSEDDETVVVKTGLGEVLVDPYVTVAGYPGLTTLPAGLWRFRTFHYVDGASGNTNAVFKVYNRSGTTETLLFTATSEDINSLTAKEYLTSYAQAAAYTVLPTDRIVVKVYGQSDHSANINFHFVYEGSLHTSHVQTPLETMSTLYIKKDGSVAFTGKQSMGGFNLTNLLDPVANQDAATKKYVDDNDSTYNASYWTGTNYNSSYATTTYVGEVNTSMKGYVDAVNATGITDHGALTGRTDDDHERYWDKDTSKSVTGTAIKRNINDSHLFVHGGDGNAGSGAYFYVGGADQITNPGAFFFGVPNAAKTEWLLMMHVYGVTDSPVWVFENRRLTSIANPIAAQDAATKNWVDTHIGSFSSQSYAGACLNNVVPVMVNGYCTDTTNHNLYIATTTLSSGWRMFTRGA